MLYITTVLKCADCTYVFRQLKDIFKSLKFKQIAMSSEESAVYDATGLVETHTTNF